MLLPQFTEILLFFYFLQYYLISSNNTNRCLFNKSNSATHKASRKRKISKQEELVGVVKMVDSVLGYDEGRCKKLDFEETELRLGIGLPCGGDKSNAKRGFAETVDLKLNLSSKEMVSDQKDIKERNLNVKEKNLAPRPTDSVKPPAKAQVVGWPPVRSFRKNAMTVQKKSEPEGTGGGGAAFVKVSMDGAPYLRKVDLKMYKTYQGLSDALGKMFGSFTTVNESKCDSQGMKDFMNEGKVMDLVKGSDYVPTYEDKDGDWMLVGDVPWEMFVESCKRLRIMKGTEAKGLAPRAMDKCKSKS